MGGMMKQKLHGVGAAHGGRCERVGSRGTPVGVFGFLGGRLPTLMLVLCTLAAAPKPEAGKAGEKAKTAAPVKGAAKPDAVPAGYVLAFSDEFEGDKVDEAKWIYRTGERYWSTQRAENVSVAGGALKLHLKKEDFGKSHYTAGGAISKETFIHGFYQARMRVPAGKGWHTSFWMMRNGGPKAGDPEAAKAKDARQEIDVCEQDSNDLHAYSANLHEWLPAHKSYGHQRVKTEANLAKDFHIYAAEFDEKQIKFYFDGELVQTVDATKFVHGPMQVWLTSIASPLNKTDAVDDGKLPEVAEFDWVRVYVKK